MLGRPGREVPVLNTVCAGSWLIWSVCIERTTQISSATEAMCGRMLDISVPLLPHFLKECWGPRTLRALPCNWAIGLPFVTDSGIALPLYSSSNGL